MANTTATYYYTNFAQLPEQIIDLATYVGSGNDNLTKYYLIAYDAVSFREIRLDVTTSLCDAVTGMKHASETVLVKIAEMYNTANEIYTRINNEWGIFYPNAVTTYNTLTSNIVINYQNLSSNIQDAWNTQTTGINIEWNNQTNAINSAWNIQTTNIDNEWLDIKESISADVSTIVLSDIAAAVDASNLDSGYVKDWQDKLGITELAKGSLENYKEDGTELSILSADTTHIYSHTIIGRDTEDSAIKTGCKAFRLASNIEHVSGETYKVVLSNSSANVSYSKLSSTAYKATTSSKLLSGLSVGDVLSINNGAKYYNAFTITKKEGNGIIFTTTNKTATTLASSVTSEKESYNFYIYCLNAPEQGIIDISDGTALAVGIGTQALNEASVATGGNTVAYGNYSFTSGRGTKAGYAAFATGRDTTASGEQSHAEGSKTIASANHSHAEGYSTKAYGSTAHSEGFGTTASGESAHSEGNYSKAYGKASHAEGMNTTAGDKDDSTKGEGAHSEGRLTTASGNYSHAEGEQTKATGKCSHAEGEQTKATGKCSHAEGSFTIASGENQLVIGRYNKQDNDQAFIIGNGTSENHRTNMFTIDWDGRLQVPVFSENNNPTGKMCTIKVVEVDGKLTLQLE